MAYKQPKKLKLRSSPYKPRSSESRTVYESVDFKQLEIDKNEETEQTTFDEYYEMKTGKKTFTVLPPPINPATIISDETYLRVFIVKHTGYIYEINNNGDYEKYSQTMLPNTYFKVVVKWTNRATDPFDSGDLNKRAVEFGAQQLPRGGGLREKFILHFNDLFGFKTSKFIGHKHISSITGRYGTGEDPNEPVQNILYDKFNNNSLQVKAPDTKNIRS